MNNIQNTSHDPLTDCWPQGTKPKTVIEFTDAELSILFHLVERDAAEANSAIRSSGGTKLAEILKAKLSDKWLSESDRIYDKSVQRLLSGGMQVKSPEEVLKDDSMRETPQVTKLAITIPIYAKTDAESAAAYYMYYRKSSVSWEDYLYQNQVLIDIIKRENCVWDYRTLRLVAKEKSTQEKQ